AAGPRVVVVASVESTLEPTAALIREEAAGRSVEVRALLVEGAWDRFEAGDMDGYVRAVAGAVDGITAADAIVLAQASMAPAQHLTRTAVPVLSSPAPGLAAAAAAARSAAWPGRGSRPSSCAVARPVPVRTATG
ncbi:arylsulfatase, partial [Streptomyces sp. NPDC001795]